MGKSRKYEKDGYYKVFEGSGMNFADKVVLVTGSSRGIGAAAALEFADKGAQVVVHYLNKKTEAEKVTKKIGKRQSLVLQGDLRKEEAVEALVGKTVEEFGRIDVLVNNAGAILRPGDWQGDVETWKQTLDVNLTSAWLMIRHVAPIMQEQESGAIVNVVSVYGFLGAAGVAAYTSAKGGLITLTKGMAKELAPEIRVNAVAPSNVMTDMTKGAGEDLIELFRQQTPLKRIAEPEEIAKAIVYMASDDASYITGEILVVDGGYSLK
jgi:NAD(P)-dependent dehydrogenase (short-subunit alcohol dehydrogenase family)